MAYDEQVVRPKDQELAELLERFVCVRVVDMNNVDLNVFKFDFDLTWMSFLMDAGERIYSRYGGRDPKSADGRLSPEGLKSTLRRVLEFHDKQPKKQTTPPRKPLLPSDVFDVKSKCLHCHQVWEGIRKQERKEKRFNPESLFVYPLPENIGLVLDVTDGNKVVEVSAGSASQRGGIKPDDVIDTIQNVKVFSQGDVMWVLHNAPVEGNISVRYLRDGKPKAAQLKLAAGWKHTDLAWRPSMKKAKGK